MTREEIEQALFTLSGHDPQFREVGLTADLWKHIERLEKALREVKSPGPTPAERLVMARNWERKR